MPLAIISVIYHKNLKKLQLRQLPNLELQEIMIFKQESTFSNNFSNNSLKWNAIYSIQFILSGTIKKILKNILVYFKEKLIGKKMSTLSILNLIL